MKSGEQKLALVTGAAHRVGRIFAMCLARQGFHILLHYHRSKNEAEQTIQEIRKAGFSATLACANLLEPDEIHELFKIVDGLSFPLKVLVNSAAVMKSGDARTLSLSDWDDTFKLNLRAPFLCAQEAAIRMESGVIVNITDVGAAKSWSGFPSYAVSKAALESLTRILARALAPDIRVNAIAPGLIMPGKGFSTEKWNKLVQRVPLHRTAAENEIEEGLTFLLSNPYVTGQTLVIDGGYSLI